MLEQVFGSGQSAALPMFFAFMAVFVVFIVFILGYELMKSAVKEGILEALETNKRENFIEKKENDREKDKKTNSGI